MKFEILIKYLLSIILIVFGANKFIPILPHMNLSPEAGEFMRNLMNSGYLINVVGAVEVTCGLMLMKRSFTPFALVILAPISVNIVLFHLFLDVSTIWMALFVSTTNVFLIYKNRDFYSPILFSITNGKTITKEKLVDSKLSYP